MLFNINTHNGKIITDEVGLTNYIKFEMKHKKVQSNCTPERVVEVVKEYAKTGRLYPFLRDSIEVKV